MLLTHGTRHMGSHRILIRELRKPRGYVSSIPGNHAPEQFFRISLGMGQIEWFAMDASISAQKEGLAFGPPQHPTFDSPIMANKIMQWCFP